MMTTAATPLRYTPKEAAQKLGLDRQYLYQLVGGGVFTPIRPKGKGPGKPLELDAGEVKAFKKGRVEAVKKYRKANRIPEPKGKP